MTGGHVPAGRVLRGRALAVGLGIIGEPQLVGPAGRVAPDERQPAVARAEGVLDHGVEDLAAGLRLLADQAVGAPMQGMTDLRVRPGRARPTRELQLAQLAPRGRTSARAARPAAPGIPRDGSRRSSPSRRRATGRAASDGPPRKEPLRSKSARAAAQSFCWRSARLRSQDASGSGPSARTVRSWSRASAGRPTRSQARASSLRGTTRRGTPSGARPGGAFTAPCQFAAAPAGVVALELRSCRAAPRPALPAGPASPAARRPGPPRPSGRGVGRPGQLEERLGDAPGRGPRRPPRP